MPRITAALVPGQVRVWTSVAAVMLAAGGLWALPVPVPAPEEVVIIANRRIPESVGLARYYAERRGIPFRNICLLDLPVRERISRAVYDQQLRKPLLAFLRKRGFIVQQRNDDEDSSNTPQTQKGAREWITRERKFRYLVSMYGVPLAVEDSREASLLPRSKRDYHSRDGAAVDSELCLLLMPPYDLGGAVNSPVFNHLYYPEGDNAALFIAATRLDGPDPHIVRRMIDETITAEETGLQGICCFDQRGTVEKDYALGDYWLEEAAERWAREGYEVIRELTPALWSEAVPLEKVAVYFGWYAQNASGPFIRPDFRFSPGAVAVHIHSSSAVTLRSRRKYWAGPLLAHGAAATIGAVDEPYLPAMPWLHILSDRLCRGYCFADAAYMSLPMLSWQITVVGDPLYRPFRRRLADQIRALQSRRSDPAFAYLRKINLLVRTGALNPALDLCRRIVKEDDSPVLREKLGDLYALNELVAPAISEYREAVSTARTPETAVRCAVKLADLLKKDGRAREIASILAEVRKRWKGSRVLRWLERVTP